MYPAAFHTSTAFLLIVVINQFGWEVAFATAQIMTVLYLAIYATLIFGIGAIIPATSIQQHI